MVRASSDDWIGEHLVDIAFSDGVMLAQQLQAGLYALLDELRGKASDYLSKNPDFDLFDTGVFEFPEES